MFEKQPLPDIHLQLDKQRKLDPVNRAYMEAYIHDLQLRQLKYKTIKGKLWRIYPLLRDLNFKDAKTITRSELEDYIINRKNFCSPVTIFGDIMELRVFFRWLVPDQVDELFQNIKNRRPRHKLPVDQLITKDDIKVMVRGCENQRDRALIMMLWDSGCRISELLTLNVGHVEFDQYGAVIIVDGKTGRRRLRLIDSVPDLQAWFHLHPFRNNPAAPLFLTHHRYGVGRKRLDHRTVEGRFKFLKKRLNLGKPMHPHAIRHARLTDLAKQGFSEMELRLIAGWERNSCMPEIYVHLSGGDVERKMLQKAGFMEGDIKQNVSLTPKECPRCKTMNPWDGMYCTSCSMALNAKAALNIEESVTTAKASIDYKEIIEAVKRELGFKM